jgi:hypothetical protein
MLRHWTPTFIASGQIFVTIWQTKRNASRPLYARLFFLARAYEAKANAANIETAKEHGADA